MFDFLLGNDPLSGIIAFFLVLIPLILIHEIGHFLAAKLAGITVLEFGIGFPPRITRLFTWRETEFTLNWLPLGGFVRPLGDDIVRPLNDEAVEHDRHEALSRVNIQTTKSVSEATPFQRIVFLSAGALANFLTAIVLFMFVALSGLPEPIGGSVEVIHAAAGSPLAKACLQDGDVILRLNGQTFDDADDFISRLQAMGGQPATITIQRSGQKEPLTLTFTPASETARTETGSYAQIAGIVPGAPADRAGIQPGDIVTAFNGAPINGLDHFKELTQQNAGKEVTISLQRGDEAFDVTLTPRTNPPEGQGAMGIVIRPAFGDADFGLIYRDGFIQEVRVAQPFDKAVQYGFERVGFVVATTASIPAQLVSGALTADEARPVSIVGLSQIGGVALQQSIEEGRPEVIVNFIAVISVALGFFNLLPLPALDGGRILFVLIEIVRGRPVAPEREGLIHLVGLVLLLSLSAIVILNDVLNPVTNLIR
ncbi:MAG: RIP metalloprotease RseP [Chloroflexi bacterium]|nr:RIP metalloprotease RseP [Chloroflexota bacterium]MDL1882824.1 RIP metalloprotease RseP [Anaerolineae bacterium CFX8]